MAIVRLNTSSDATWQRAWSVANAAERATLIATYVDPGGPRRGDIIFQVDTGIWYLVVDINIIQQVSGLPSGDVVGPSSSVASEVVLFDGTSGKLIKRATGTGIVRVASGVYGTPGAVNLASEVTGTLPDGNLSSNVPLKNAANDFSADQEISAVSPSLILEATGGTLNAKKISLNAAGGDFNFTFLNDNNTFQSLVWTSSRSTLATQFAASIEALGIIAATGGGVLFPSTQIPSSNANTLDDYEEGTWTPSDASGAGLSFTNASGDYIKIGRMVYAAGRCDYPATASGAGVAIGGLPFTVRAGQNSWSGSFSFNNTGVSYNIPCIGGTTTFQLYTTAGVQAINSAISGKILTFTQVYAASA